MFFKEEKKNMLRRFGSIVRAHEPDALFNNKVQIQSKKSLNGSIAIVHHATIELTEIIRDSRPHQ